jgi:hypothetical protein
MTIVTLLFFWLVFVTTVVFADPIVPTSPSFSSLLAHVVQQNFLGISFELSFHDDYCELILLWMYFFQSHDFCL